MPDFSSYPIINYWIFLQVLARVSSLIAIAPVFGATQVPTQVKILIAIALSFVVWPLAFNALHSQGIPLSFYTLAAILAENAAIGLVMGFIASLLLTAVQMAGAILDLQVGFTIAQTFNPSIGDIAAPLTQLQYLYALLLFLLANGHYMLISAIGQSFAILPVSLLKMDSNKTINFFTALTANTLVNGVKIAAPAAAVMLIVDISFAFLSKAVPQMNVFMVGTPAKAALGLLVLAAVLPMMALLFGHVVGNAPYDLSAALTSMER